MSLATARHRRALPALALVAALTGHAANAAIAPPGAITDEPVTIGIAVGLGTSLAITLIYDQSTANFLSTALAYAKPQADATLGWRLGRGEAYAYDVDFRTATMPRSDGEASASVNWVLPDSLDPKMGSFGSYHNVVRTFKNGSLRNAQSGGVPGANDDVSKVTVDINGFGSNKGRTKISITGGAGGATDGPGSLGAIYKLGAAFDDVANLWVPWLPTASGLDAPVAEHYNEDAFGAPSIAQIAQAADASTCLDFSDMLVGALNAATSVAGSHFSVGPVSLTLDIGGAFDTVHDPSLNWWQSVQAEAAADAVIPTPGSAALLALASACLAFPRRR